MHIETLKIFCDVVENQSFSQAASQNYITQSAVSQQIRGLEERYGKRLLERRRGSVRPTAAGEILHRAAREILHLFNEMEAELQGLSNVVTGSVRVGTVHSVGLYLLTEPLKAYFADFPHVNVYLEYDRASHVYEQVLRGNVDLGIVAYPTARARITVLEFRTDRLVVVCAPDHPLAEHREVRLEALDGEKFVGFEKGIPTRQALDRMFEERGIHVEYVAELDNIEMVKRLVEVGAGVAIIPEKACVHEVAGGSLVKVELGERALTRPIGIIHRTGKHFSPAAEKFIEYLQRGAGHEKGAAPKRGA
ncbi:MAG: LysR family transcriptional regulator [Candidatus Dadabacteria bacterium]|nr:MAG: LysR family transcriptional regulator [Candidatus Dadabacteria bacterium]